MKSFLIRPFLIRAARYHRIRFILAVLITFSGFFLLMQAMFCEYGMELFISRPTAGHGNWNVLPHWCSPQHYRGYILTVRDGPPHRGVGGGPGGFIDIRWLKDIDVRDPSNPFPETFYFGFSYWALAFLMLLSAFLVWRNLYKKTRALANMCKNCGYDLRAHGYGQNCPECGKFISWSDDIYSNEFDE